MERLLPEAFIETVKDSTFDYRAVKVNREDEEQMKQALGSYRADRWTIIGHIFEAPFVTIFFSRLHQGDVPATAADGYEVDAVITNDLPKNHVFEVHRGAGWKPLHVKRWTSFDLEAMQPKVCVAFFVRQLKGE